MNQSKAGKQVFLAIFAIAILALFLPGYGLETAHVQVGGEAFRVELATSAAEQRRGLMHREQLPQGTGMLFVYQHPQPVSFWNKDVRFPIDILYFDANSALIRTDTHVPPCPYRDCPRYRTAAPVKYVLELPAGTTERLKLKPGDRLQFL
ncbi:DUF192 domain-containing protein [Thiohalomonas denitrificans]|uniref:ACR n=1 Tax=Thiohalomonas denitrificans TaxID=415747 RepID=A0A1G5PMX6_9GAMM|nr:DUF192 domain-containing protein [Thiohalomonas denitrificans]SCZ50817.1 hypothetical protein SAMN03097708_00505 [Thiohalomonas denitrificans]